MDSPGPVTTVSRRTALVTLGAGGLGLTLAARTAAQEATPTPLPPAMTEWIAGWQAHDPNRVVGAYTEDAVHEVVATGAILGGRTALHDNVAALVAAFPDAALTVNGAFATNEAGAIDWTFTGTYTAPYPGFPPPTGQAIALRAVLLVELTGGLIARASEFYDLFGLLVQLGVLPVVGVEGAPDATPAV